MGQLLSRPFKPIEDRPFLTFTHFPKLPPELRNKIWELALPGPRKITIEACDCTIQPSKLQHRHRPQPNKSDIPITLHVCRESRSIALKYYSLAFSYRLRRAVYFDFEMDTLHLVDEIALRAFRLSYDPDSDEQIAEWNTKNLHVGIEYGVIFGHAYSRIQNFEALQQLTIEFYHGRSLDVPPSNIDLVQEFCEGWKAHTYNLYEVPLRPRITRLRYGFREILLPCQRLVYSVDTGDSQGGDSDDYLSGSDDAGDTA